MTMNDKNPTGGKKPTSGKNERFVIKVKTPEYYKALKKLYESGISRNQVHRILDLTKGDIIGLKVARHIGTPNIWFN